MLNQLAGQLWWLPAQHDVRDYDAYLEVGGSVYRCSRSDDAWRRVEVLPEPDKFVFSAPLMKTISNCLTDSAGCRYVVFSDDTALRIFDPPPAAGFVILHSEGVDFLDRNQWRHFVEKNGPLSKTPILDA